MAGDEHRDVVPKRVAQDLECRGRDQRGMHPEAAGSGQDAHALAALDNEQPATLPQLRVLEVAVVGDALVSRAGDSFDLHARRE